MRGQFDEPGSYQGAFLLRGDIDNICPVDSVAPFEVASVELEVADRRSSDDRVGEEPAQARSDNAVSERHVHFDSRERVVLGDFKPFHPDTSRSA